MQKIMFNDKYGLTQAVLGGRKTMTRRIIDAPSNAIYMKPVLDLCGNIIKVYALDPDGRTVGVFFPKYRVGEVVAVAQRYCDIKEYNPEDYEDVMLSDGAICEALHPYAHLMREPGWNNKMFVKAELMPHQIRITNIRYERLQDISDEDCLLEGIVKIPQGFYSFEGWGGKNDQWYATKAREAFAALIDKVSGKGTWGNNPWYFAYEFELVK